MNEHGQVGIFLLVIVVVLVIGGGAAWYYMQGRSGVTVSPTPTATSQHIVSSPTPIPTAAAGENLTGRITDLVKQGQNLSCSFQRTDEASTIQGTVYVAGQGEKLRGNFHFQQAAGLALNGHMVRQEQTLYLWSDELPQGTKFTVTEEAGTSASEQSSSPFLDESFQYQCQPWTVDESFFMLPANVQFVDVTAQIQQFQTGTPGF